MKRMMLAFAFCAVLLAVNVASAVPVAEYDPGYPGLRIDFKEDLYPGPGDNGYGYMTHKVGWAHDGWSGYASAAGAFARMETTLLNAGNNKTSMQEDQDWVFSATYSHVGPQTSEFVIFGKYDWDGTNEYRMFAVSQNPNEGTYGFLVGNASGGWDTVASGLTFSEWQEITIHYKVGQGLDYYLGNTLVASNQTTGHGRYDLDFMQIEWTKAGTDKWRAFKVGQVPEPLTMTLLGIGGLALIRRRRS